MEPLDFARERQVLDRGPAGNDAELRDVEVGIAAVGTDTRYTGLAGVAGRECGAIGALGRGSSCTQQIVIRSASYRTEE